MSTLRLKARSIAINKWDPVYVFLDKVVFQSLFQPPKPNQTGEYEKLEQTEVEFLLSNLKKHRLILWINIIVAIFLESVGLGLIPAENKELVIAGLLAPAMITGSAWYAITFGGIGEKFLNIAVDLTFTMFLSFTLSMTLLTILLISITPWVGLFIVVPIYLSLYHASVLYDNVDGLKIGLDSTMLKFSRASLNYYLKHGLVTSSETNKEAAYDDSTFTSEEVAMYTYLLKTLESYLEQLENEKELAVANHLIASSTEVLYKMLSIKEPLDANTRKKVAKYVREAHMLDQTEVDKDTAVHLDEIIDKLSSLIGSHASEELTDIRGNLDVFMLEEARQTQVMADAKFAQTFRQLLELVSAYRHFIFGTQKE